MLLPVQSVAAPPGAISCSVALLLLDGHDVARMTLDEMMRSSPPLLLPNVTAAAVPTDAILRRQKVFRAEELHPLSYGGGGIWQNITSAAGRMLSAATAFLFLSGKAVAVAKAFRRVAAAKVVVDRLCRWPGRLIKHKIT